MIYIYIYIHIYICITYVYIYIYICIYTCECKYEHVVFKIHPDLLLFFDPKKVAGYLRLFIPAWPRVAVVAVAEVPV